MGTSKVIFTETTGEVIQAGKTTETYVSGSGGRTMPVSITSTITTKDQIFLMLPSGNEHALSLAGFSNLACRPGHTITTVFAQTPRFLRKPTTPWSVAVYNHNTQQTAWNWANLGSYGSVSLLTIAATFFGTWMLCFVIAASWGPDGLMTGFVGGAILGVVAGWAIEKYLQQARASRLQSDAQRHLDEALARMDQRRAS